MLEWILKEVFIVTIQHTLYSHSLTHALPAMRVWNYDDFILRVYGVAAEGIRVRTLYTGETNWGLGIPCKWMFDMCLSLSCHYII